MNGSSCPVPFHRVDCSGWDQPEAGSPVRPCMFHREHFPRPRHCCLSLSPYCRFRYADFRRVPRLLLPVNDTFHITDISRYECSTVCQCQIDPHYTLARCLIDFQSLSTRTQQNAKSCFEWLSLARPFSSTNFQAQQFLNAVVSKRCGST